MNEKTNVLLTGATSGIGLAIGKLLASHGYQVYGLGRQTQKVGTLPESFFLFSCDITDDAALAECLSSIRRQMPDGCPDIVIHCAGVGYYGLHETLSRRQLRELVATNLEAPMVLTSLLLPTMKKRRSGHFIFLSSVTAESSNPHGCAYGATKAALSSFAKSLFEEVRKTNIKVTTLQPDMTMTDLYRNADFTAEETACLFPEDVADAVWSVLHQPAHCNISMMTLKPQLHRIRKKQIAKYLSEDSHYE